MFECNKCYKLFHYSYLLNKHNSKNILCNTPKKIIKNLTLKIEQLESEILNNNNKSIESKNICYYCTQTFSTKYSMIRHMNNICTNKKKLIEDKNKYTEIIKQKEEELKKDNIHKQELKKSKSINKNITNINNGTINNNNINNNINNNNVILNHNVNINPFGKEDLSHIPEGNYKEYIKKLLPGLIKFIQDVHFSPDKPENHNICVPTLKSSTIAVYKDGQWNALKKNDTLNKLLNNKITTLDNKFYKYEENNLLNQIEIDDFNNCMARCFDDDNKKSVYEDVELMMYNNRKLINNYINLIEP